MRFVYGIKVTPATVLKMCFRHSPDIAALHILNQSYKTALESIIAEIGNKLVTDCLHENELCLHQYHDGYLIAFPLIEIVNGLCIGYLNMKNIQFLHERLESRLSLASKKYPELCNLESDIYELDT